MIFMFLGPCLGSVHQLRSVPVCSFQRSRKTVHSASARLWKTWSGSSSTGLPRSPGRRPSPHSLCGLVQTRTYLPRSGALRMALRTRCRFGLCGPTGCVRNSSTHCRSSALILYICRSPSAPETGSDQTEAQPVWQVTTARLGSAQPEAATRHRAALWIDLAATIPLLVDRSLVRRWHGLDSDVR